MGNLSREVWIASIIEGLFGDTTFASRSIDHSEFVNFKTVNVPNAGSGSNVEKNRTTLPANVTTRDDFNLMYDINEFTTDPIRVPHAETVELSYSKRESIIRVDRATLHDKVHLDLLTTWLTGAATIVPGANERATVMKCKRQFDNDHIPQVGRCMMFNAEGYNNLLEQLSDSETNHFLAGADPIRGILGKWMGFDYYMHSTLDGTSTGMGWWDNAVSRALGEVEFFDNQGDATFYGDIMSFLVRAGGKAIRHDTKGILKF